jgi:hypothetical protein
MATAAQSHFILIKGYTFSSWRCSHLQSTILFLGKPKLNRLLCGINYFAGMKLDAGLLRGHWSELGR